MGLHYRQGPRGSTPLNAERQQPAQSKRKNHPAGPAGGALLARDAGFYWLTIPPGAVPAMSSLLSPPLWNVPATEVDAVLLTMGLSVMRTVDPATPLRPTVEL